MTPTDFWSKSHVSVLGAGQWGSVLAQLIAPRCGEITLWSRQLNVKLFEGVNLDPKIKLTDSLQTALSGKQDVVVWALPSAATREVSQAATRFFTGKEILIHATKGVEEKTLKRISQVLFEEIPCPRIGVLSGPNLAGEIAKQQPAAIVIASEFDEVIEAAQTLLATPQFRVYSSKDVIGVEWAGALKNILAIAAGVLDSMNLGWNSRAMLITRGLAEMVRFGLAVGAKESTFLGLAGIGDLLATCSSPLSRNFRVGRKLGEGQRIEIILKELGSTAEGVSTCIAVWEYAAVKKIEMPITQGVYNLLKGQMSPSDVMKNLMSRPQIKEN